MREGCKMHVLSRLLALRELSYNNSERASKTTIATANHCARSK